MARYAQSKGAQALLEAERHKTEAKRLKAAIREHHSQVHSHNWSADDDLWAAIGLEADSEVIG